MWNKQAAMLISKEAGTPLDKIARRLIRIDNTISTVCLRDDIQNGPEMLADLRFAITLALKEVFNKNEDVSNTYKRVSDPDWDSDDICVKYRWILKWSLKAQVAINQIPDFGTASMFFDCRGMCEEITLICHSSITYENTKGNHE